MPVILDLERGGTTHHEFSFLDRGRGNASLEYTCEAAGAPVGMRCATEAERLIGCLPDNAKYARLTLALNIRVSDPTHLGVSLRGDRNQCRTVNSGLATALLHAII